MLGIDPGSSATGWGLVVGEGNRCRLIDFGVIRPKGSERSRRLNDLAVRFRAVVEACQPDEAAVETPFTGRNPRSTVALAECRGVLLSVLGSRSIPSFDYAPADVKKSVVGSGRAEKSQVAFMVCRLLGLQETPPHDASDAMALALTHLHQRRFHEISKASRRP